MSNRYVNLASRCLLALSGPDARPFLQGLLSQDMNKVTSSHAAYALLLNAQGKWLFDCFVIQRDDSIWLEMDGTRAEDFKRLLAMYKLRAQVEIKDITSHYHTLVVIGDVTRLSLTAHAGRCEFFDVSGGVAFTDPRLPALGARVIAPLGEGETWVQMRGFAQTTPQDYLHHRIRLGVPEGDSDNIPGKTLPIEHGMDLLNAVSFDKGCFIGQEVTTRTKFRAHLQKQLYIVNSESGTLPEAGAPIISGEREVGVLHSHIGTPTLGTVGLATLRKDAVDQPLIVEGHTFTASEPPWRKEIVD